MFRNRGPADSLKHSSRCRPKRSDADVSQALAEGLRIATGYPTAVTLLNRHHDNTLVPVAVSSVNGELKSDRITPESFDGDTAVTRAARQGSAISLGRGGLSSEYLPEWALELGYRSGIAAPIKRGMEVLGAVYLLRADVEAPGLKSIEHTEVLTSSAIEAPNGWHSPGGCSTCDTSAGAPHANGQGARA